jgi:hypothetical protein
MSHQIGETRQEAKREEHWNIRGTKEGDGLMSGAEEGSRGESATVAEENSALGSSPRCRWLRAYREAARQQQLRAYRRRICIFWSI